jgi:hypothetical protein
MKNIKIEKEFQIPGTPFVLEEGDQIKIVENAIAAKIGEFKFYLISLLMDIYNNSDLDFKKEISAIEDITSKKITSLYTKSIAIFAKKPDYNVSITNYQKMSSELDLVLSNKSFSFTDIRRLETLYYGG